MKAEGGSMKYYVCSRLLQRVIGLFAIVRLHRRRNGRGAAGSQGPHIWESKNSYSDPFMNPVSKGGKQMSSMACRFTKGQYGVTQSRTRYLEMPELSDWRPPVTSPCRKVLLQASGSKCPTMVIWSPASLFHHHLFQLAQG